MPDPSAFPTSPSQPVASNTTDSELDLEWKAPERNGASPVVGYHIQYYSPELGQVDPRSFFENNMEEPQENVYWKLSNKTSNNKIRTSVDEAKKKKESKFWKFNSPWSFFRPGTTWTTTWVVRAIEWRTSNQPILICSLSERRMKRASAPQVSHHIWSHCRPAAR